MLRNFKGKKTRGKGRGASILENKTYRSPYFLEQLLMRELFFYRKIQKVGLLLFVLRDS